MEAGTDTRTVPVVNPPFDLCSKTLPWTEMTIFWPCGQQKVLSGTISREHRLKGLFW